MENYIDRLRTYREFLKKEIVLYSKCADMERRKVVKNKGSAAKVRSLEIAVEQLDKDFPEVRG
jgi:hypothetical protein